MDDIVQFLLTMAKKTTESKLNKKEQNLVKEMIKAGVHFGHSKSRKDPRMDPFIEGLRNNVSIIDLNKTITKLEEALKFLQRIVKQKGTILFVGIQPQAKEITRKTAEKCNMPYMVERWLGGTLTNFKTICKRIDYLISLEKRKKAGELKKYTKKEQMLFDEEIEKLNRDLGGIKGLEKLPDAVFVMSVRHNLGAVKEARRKNIPIVGLVDTDSNPALANYPIPANDDAFSALEFILNQIGEAVSKQETKVKK